MSKEQSSTKIEPGREAARTPAEREPAGAPEAELAGQLAHMPPIADAGAPGARPEGATAGAPGQRWSGIPLRGRELQALQRTLGNRATGRALGRHGQQRVARAGAIQRAMYLSNADDNIYKDSDDDASEYAYIAKGQVPFFIEYANVAKLQANAVIKNWLATMNERNFNRQIDEVAAQAAANDANAKSVIADLGEIRSVDVNGKVVNVPVDLNNFNSQMLISKLVRDAVVNGAAYWNVGGGSRLPRGEGHLLYNKAYPKETLLAMLGLDEADLATVKTYASSLEMILAQRDEAQKNGNNIFELKLSSTSQVPDVLYISLVTARRSKSSRVTCAGANFADDFSDIGGNKGTLDNSFKGLTAPKSSAWLPGTTLTTVDRGEGQAKAMNKWNALGAAAWGNYALGHKLNLDQNWEWLHIQGAQIGGQTVGGNLVPGLFVTNSHMIPYENMIREWAQADPTKFWAKFEADSLGGTVFASQIKISIMAKGHSVLGDVQFEPLVVFNPISGSIVDKVAGEIIKRGIDQRRRI